MSESITRHYVTFYYPGTIVAETEDRPVESRDPAKLDLPSGAYAFYFFDRVETTVDGEKLEGKKKNISGTYYPNGKICTQADVKAMGPTARILLQNMESNKWDRVVMPPNGRFCQPLKDADVVYELDTE